jgi:hypothetical protein
MSNIIAAGGPKIYRGIKKILCGWITFGHLKNIVGRNLMKKHLVSISAISMLISMLLGSGCGSDGGFNLGILALLPGGNSISGSSENVMAAGAAMTGIGTALSTAQQQSTGLSGGSMSIAKDYIDEEVVPDIKVRAIKAAAASGSTCDGTVQPINKHFTSPFSEDGLYVEPDLVITGTSQCISNSDGSTTTNWVLDTSGSISTTFTDKKVCSFDIEDFVKNKNFNFIEHTLNGQVTVGNIYEKDNLSSTSKYESTSDGYTTTMTMSVKGNASCHSATSNLSVDGGAAMSFDLVTNISTDWIMSSSGTFNSTMGTYSLREPTYAGSESHSINGTVNAEQVSINYRFNADDYRNYNAAFRSASCCSTYGTMTFTIDGTLKNYNMCMAMESSSGTTIMAMNSSNSTDLLEYISLNIGDGAVGDHNNSSFADYEFIYYGTLSDSILHGYYGITSYSGSSTIAVEANNDSVIKGTFSGTVCDTDTAPACKIITDGKFTARKSMM